MTVISTIAAASLRTLRTILDFHSRSLWSRDDSPNIADQSPELRCVICLRDISSGEKYRVLPECNHGFHVDCIDVWLQKNSTCPLCRCPAPYTSMKLQQHDYELQLLYLHDAILSCFIFLVDHFWTWFVDPIGLDRACEDNYQSLP
ncbi:RING-H2 finger protein ATL8-like [Coffea eugenioides]|uniref:RING-H2 finger protein ATL32-like n=1 Tax=Coffea arabica TaxID=13443 RepID=A0A6P6T0F6_COFAR|nr:RING-H2 finger protein ATL8-like [Coffea arabica]XP_027155947.1 RING-H2 finger protein ATL8-like [Coffea eugenioides]XP_027174383.1 RING-H2 finger protein ATL8-like [Coffea eugenioides]